MKVALVSIISLLFLTRTWSAAGKGFGSEKASPILIIPGLMGSQLEVDDHPEDIEQVLCVTIGYYKVWVDVTRLVWDFAIHCAKRELELVWDATTNTYSNHPGVKSRAKDFGGTEGVERLNIRIPYFKDMVDFFVTEYNYTRNISIRAAPYDWRLAADALEKLGYFDRVKALVEEMYEANEQRKVTIIGHSMGGPVSHYLLTRYAKVNQAWKDKYIHAYVTLAGAWSGGNSALQDLISGPSHLLPTLGINMDPFLDRKLAPILHSLESIYWMLPRASVWHDTTLVSTPTKSYTANDYEQMFKDVGLENSFSMYSKVLEMSPDFPPPNVPTHCFYGVGLDTMKEVIYDQDFSGVPPTGVQPTAKPGDGDKTVNIESSEMCLAWVNMSSKYPFEHKTFKDVSHGDIVSNSTVLAELAKIVGV